MGALAVHDLRALDADGGGGRRRPVAPRTVFDLARELSAARLDYYRTPPTPPMPPRRGARPGRCHETIAAAPDRLRPRDPVVALLTSPQPPP